MSIPKETPPDDAAQIDNRVVFVGDPNAAWAAAYRSGRRAAERGELRAVPGIFECNSDDWLKGYDGWSGD